MPSPPSLPLSPERRRLRSLKAIAVREGHQAEADRLDTELRAARLATRIRETLDATPPLTAEQRLALAGMLAEVAR
jgi:hypothetical protein